MFMAAAKALAEISLRTKLPDGNILPPVSALRNVAFVARAVGSTAIEEGALPTLAKLRLRAGSMAKCGRPHMRRMRVLAEDRGLMRRKFQLIGKDRFSRISIRVVVYHEARAGGDRAANSTCSPASAFMYRIPTPTRTSGHIVPDPMSEKRPGWSKHS